MRRVQDSDLKQLFPLLGAQRRKLLEEVLPMLYTQTLEEMVGRFTSEELSLLLLAHEGGSRAAMVLGRYIFQNCELHLPFYKKRDDINPSDLKEKIESLPYWSRVCLELWASGWWSEYKRLGTTKPAYKKRLLIRPEKKESA
jgi:hypothetical protein